MLIGVISDTHDHLTTIDRAIGLFDQRGVQAMIHPGDLVAPFAAQRLLKYNGPIYVTYGNNDGEREGLRKRGHLDRGQPAWTDALPPEWLRGHRLHRTRQTHEPGDRPPGQNLVRRRGRGQRRAR